MINESDKVILILLGIVLVLLGVISPIVGSIICFKAARKNRKRLQKLEKECTKFVGVVKKVSMHPSANEYDENTVCIVEVDGKDIEVFQHTAPHVVLSFRGHLTNKKILNNKRLDVGQLPEGLKVGDTNYGIGRMYYSVHKDEQLSVGHADYGIVGTKVNIYKDGEKFVTDIDEQRKISRYEGYFISLVLVTGVFTVFLITCIIPEIMQLLK